MFHMRGPKHTVRSFSSFFDVGILFHGSHPHPARRPPGVWYIRKLSPSPTLVTRPSRLRRRKDDGEMFVAWGMRRKYLRCTWMTRRIPLVRRTVGTRFWGSLKCSQSVALRSESHFRGGPAEEEEEEDDDDEEDGEVKGENIGDASLFFCRC